MTAAQQEKVLQDSIRALRQGGKQTQVEAIHSLGRLEDRRAVAALVSALESADPDVRALAMGKLAFLNSRSIVPVLVRSLDDKEPRVRQHALYALQRLKARSAADKIATLLTGDNNGMVRFNAALALAAVGGRSHAAWFARVLNDRNPNVILTALRALAALAPRQVSSHILRLVRDTRRWKRIPPSSRDVILRLLKNSLGKKSVLALLRKIVTEAIRRAERQGTPPLSMDAMEAACLLADAGDASGVPVLLASLKGGEYSQERGVGALARLKERSAVPFIVEGPLQNGFYPIKLKAVRALGEIGDARALPALASFFNGRIDDFPVDRTLTFAKDDPDLCLTALAAIARIAAQSLRKATRSSDAFETKLARSLPKAVE